MGNKVLRVIPIFVGLMLLSSAAYGTEYDASANDVYVPQKYTDNDQIEVVIDGWLENECDRPLEPKVSINLEAGVITVQARAKRDYHVCQNDGGTFVSTAKLGVLPYGEYEVVTNNGWLVHELIVEESPSSGETLPQLARIEESKMEFDREASANGWSVLIKGMLRDSCEFIDGYEIFTDGTVFTVIPKLGHTGEVVCIDVVVPFNERVHLPVSLEAGRYMMHVRGAKTTSTNEVFEVL